MALTALERTRIQMEYVVPLIKDLQAILGEDVVNNALDERNRRNTEANQTSGDKADFTRMADGAKMFAAGDALDYEVIASDNDSFDMDVHRCGYTLLMEELGGRDFGHLLVCNTDFPAAARLGMTLTRTQTQMQGAAFCNFRYRRAPR